MADLQTTFLGLNLKNPIIAASCGLTNNIESIKKLSDNGIGAIVLKSLFEEQILYHAHQKIAENKMDYPEAYDYIKNYSRINEIEQYLLLIQQAKKTTAIPIIASINCISASEWVSFAKEIEQAGADALELNIMTLPTNGKISSSEVEQKMFDIIDKVRSQTKLPLAIKLNNHYTSLSNILTKLDWNKLVQGVVLFNRQYTPDIDIDKMKIVAGNVFSSPTEYTESLRWIAIMSNKVNYDFAATTGIWDGKTVIKQLLAGAKAVQISSVLYKKGHEVIPQIIGEIENWMQSKGYQKISQFRGSMSMQNVESPAAFERIQFMRYFSQIE
ncbi:MAG: dihydroorotate dehydrogenase-like protein [Bacteroidales bacterium]|nr:dihydroorotate dehydrogenase-like protein [Bacteroidales bacterium]